MRVVIIPEFAQLARQVRGVPEEYPIKVFTPDSSDQPFDERMSLYCQLHPELTVQNDVSA